MAISVNELTGVISVPKSDTVLIGTDSISGREIRTYDCESLRIQLRDWEDSEVGRDRPTTHTVTREEALGITTFSRVFKITDAYYTVEFLDPLAEQYRVVLTGNNNNVADVAVINGVSVQPSNSAGLILNSSSLSPADLTAIATAVWDFVISGWKARRWLHVIFSAVMAKVSGATQYGTPGTVVFRDKDDTINVASVSNDGLGNRTSTTFPDDPEP